MGHWTSPTLTGFLIAELEELKLQPTISGEVVRQLYGILFAKLPTSEVDSQEMR